MLRIFQHPIWVFFLLSAIVLVVFWPSTSLVWQAWTGWGGYHSHGLLVLALVLILFWNARQDLVGAPSRRREEAFWWLSLIGFSVLWFTAWGTDVRPLEVVALFGLLFSIGCLIFGRHAWKTFGTRFGLFTFSLPFWYNLEPILQVLAAQGVELLLQQFAITVYFDGNLIHIPQGTIEIARSCSGLGFLLVSLSLASYIVVTSEINFQATALTYFIATILALVSNWLRISLIVLIGYGQGIDHPMVQDHDGIGWVVYVMVNLPFLIFAIRKFKLAGSTSLNEPTEVKHYPKVGKVIVILSIVIFFPTYVRSLPEVLPSEEAFHEITESYKISRETLIANWNPVFPPTDFQQFGIVKANGGNVVFLRAGYLKQPVGVQIINRSEALIPQGWEVQTKLAGSKDAKYNQIKLVHKTGDGICLRYWYDIGGNWVSDRIEAKLTRLLKKAQGRGDTQIIALAIPADNDCHDKVDVLESAYLSMRDSAFSPADS